MRKWAGLNLNLFYLFICICQLTSSEAFILKTGSVLCCFSEADRSADGNWLTTSRTAFNLLELPEQGEPLELGRGEPAEPAGPAEPSEPANSEENQVRLKESKVWLKFIGSNVTEDFWCTEFFT